MKPGSTLLLKGAVIVIGLAVIAFCAVALPVGIMSDQTDLYRPILIGMYIPMIPFFIGLFQAWKLLNLIDNNNAFSDTSVSALKIIKICSLIIAGLYTAGMPFVFRAADIDDAPGVVAIALIIIFASFVLSTFAALLQRLLQNALDIKSENDLTV